MFSTRRLDSPTFVGRPGSLYRAVRLLLPLLLLLAAAVSRVSALPGTFPANFSEQTHHSDALDRDRTFALYIPPDAQEGERFPVLYMLHGAWGNYTDWPKATNLSELVDRYRMIIVCPDGAQFGWYLDSPVVDDSQYETYVAKELVEYVDAHFPTVAERGGRGIMGLSMGGQGALRLAARHPETFGSASSLSGVLQIRYHPDKWHLLGVLGPIDKYESAWRANSIIDQAPLFGEANLKLLFDSGVDDGEKQANAINEGREFHEILTGMGVPHIWREWPGGHSWEYWNTHLPEHLNFHQAAMIDATPGLGKWTAHYFKRMAGFFDENARLALEEPDGRTTLCLLGSSGCEGMPDDLFPGYRVFNRGIAADALGIGARGVSKRMTASVSDMRPDFVLFNCGTNDIGNQVRSERKTPTNERIAQEYEAVLDTIAERLPETKVIVLNCAPTRGRYTNLNEAIVDYNARLKAIAERRGLGYVDLHSAVVDESGELAESLTTDGLHLVKEGKERYAALMIAEVERLLEEAAEGAAPAGAPETAPETAEEKTPEAALEPAAAGTK